MRNRQIVELTRFEKYLNGRLQFRIKPFSLFLRILYRNIDIAVCIYKPWGALIRCLCSFHA